jgi:hypothetical protein
VGDRNEELLTLAMAVVDGEAGPIGQRKLDVALARDPSLAADLDAFRLTGRRLGQVFDGIAAAPVPDYLVQLVMSTPMKPARRISGIKPGLVARMGERWQTLLTSWEVPSLVFAAAAAAFAAGGLLTAGHGPAATAPVQTASLGSLTPSPALVEALAKVETGSEQKVVTSGGAISVRVVETFRDGSANPCREYEAQGPSGPRQYGVACHVDNGWQLKAVFEGPARTGAITTAGPGEYSETLDAVAGRLRQGDDVSADEERKLIAGGWATAH